MSQKGIWKRESFFFFRWEQLVFVFFSIFFPLSLPRHHFFFFPTQGKKKTHHVGQDPARDPDRVHDLRRQLPPAPGSPRVEQPPAAREGDARGVVGRVRVADERHVGEEPGGEDAPEAVPRVHRDGVERVVELDLDRHLGREQVERARHGADDDRGPRAHDVARRGDRREAGEAAVAHVLDAVHRLARRDLGLDRADDERGQARGGGRERRRDGGVGDGEVVGRARDRLLRPRVEAVPAEPEDHHSEDEQARVVAGHRDDGAIGEEAADARPDDEGAGGGGEAFSKERERGGGGGGGEKRGVSFLSIKRRENKKKPEKKKELPLPLLLLPRASSSHLRPCAPPRTRQSRSRPSGTAAARWPCSCWPSRSSTRPSAR